MTLGSAVVAALEAARAADGDAAALWSAWSAPWRIAVIGAVGVGKTTLANRIAGTERATGLGGVTRQVVEVGIAGAILVDTPGLDGAAPWLDRVLAASDAVIWVIDPLRALAWSEREEVSRAWPGRLTLHAVVRRLPRSDPAEEAEVLDRIARMFGSDGLPPAESISTRDLARGEPARDLVVRTGAGPARSAALADGCTALRASVAARDPGPWGEGWRAAVGAVEAAAAELVGDSVDPALALHRAASATVLPEWPVPPLPLPTAPVRASPVAARRRRLRAEAARWLAEGDLALREWLAAEDRSRSAARAAVAELRIALADAGAAGHDESER